MAGDAVAATPARAAVPRWSTASRWRSVGAASGSCSGPPRRGRGGVLAPVVLPRACRSSPSRSSFRLVGGLLRRLWAGRLAAPPGQPQRPAHDGHRFRVPRCRRCLRARRLAVRRRPSRAGSPTCGRCSSSRSLLTYRTGGRLRTVPDRVLVGAVGCVEIVVLAPLWLVFAEDPATLLLVVPTRGRRGHRHACSGCSTSRLSVGTAARASPRGGARRRLRAAARCCRAWRGALPAAVRGAARPSTSSAAARVTRSCCGSPPARSRSVPVAFLAGLLRSRLARGGLADLFGGLAHDAARRAAGRAGPGAARPGVRDRLRRPGRRLRRRRRPCRSSFPGRRPAGRSRR